MLEELTKGKADAREAAAAVLLMQQQPSFGAGKQQRRGQAASSKQPRQQSQQSQSQQQRGDSQSKASAYRSTHRVQAEPQPVQLDMEADFPTLGGSRKCKAYYSCLWIYGRF